MIYKLRADTPGAMIQQSEYLQQLIIQIYIKRLLLLDLTHAPHIQGTRFIIILNVSGTLAGERTHIAQPSTNAVLLGVLFY